MQFRFLCLFFFFYLLYSMAAEKTCFQTYGPWRAELDFHSDVAIVYGMNASFCDRLASWKTHGYGLHFMTGVAWGEYADYIQGRFDGKNHVEDGQVQRDGEIIWHSKGVVPYMVPSLPYLEYMKSLVKSAIDQGITAIHLEEPEFWARAGYSEGFKKEWQNYYHEAWQAPHESADAAWRSSKLKYYLYYRALDDVFRFAKKHSADKGAVVDTYVPTHSLINYAKWGIVSPEASLASLPQLDGYIAQVWTGTARSPVYYEGLRKERTFETAFLEYGSMVAMTRPTGRRVYFLTDPIEDDPEHTWQDYKHNYQCTFTAQLMYPMVEHYEVMPWPDRIFFGTFQTAGLAGKQPIPADYATQILILINVLNDMRISNDQIAGTQGIGVLISDTMMFQRFPEFSDYSDPDLSDFFGMALPLLKLGVPVQIVQMENLPHPETLKDIKLLIMSYANMKPLDPNYHLVINQWVRNGGSLIYLGRDNDSFQRVREWWNQQANNFPSPSAHLFKLLGIDTTSGSEFQVGNGRVTVLRQDPKELVMQENGADILRRLVHNALYAKGQAPLQEKNWLHLQRGVYDIAAVLDESVSDLTQILQGPFIDLYDPELSVVQEKSIAPGQTALLYNLKRSSPKQAMMLAAASRWEEKIKQDHTYECALYGPAATQGVARIYLPAKAKSISLKKQNGTLLDFLQEWHVASHTVRITYANEPNGAFLKMVY